MLQVLKNLVENALRYTPQGGEIRLSAAEEGERVQLRVSDSGAGIDPEDLPYVFDRFLPRRQSARGQFGQDGPGAGHLQGAGHRPGRHHHRRIGRQRPGGTEW